MGQSQRANPGGILDPKEIVGRDELAARLWRILERRSLSITAERRMGKTSIVRDKMGGETPAGIKMVYLDTSRAASPLEFVEILLHKSCDLLDFGKRAKFFLAEAAKWGSNLEIKAAVGVKLPPDLGAKWKSLLESLLRDLSTHSDRIVLVFDELPLMLLSIRGSDGAGEDAVMELLDLLRAARQTNPSLRMIYTGSLGLHHVLTTLKAKGYQNDPTNDMTLIAVEPLAPEFAEELAFRLLNGERVACKEVRETAQYLATVTDGMPYYIHHLVEEMAAKGLRGDTATIDRLLASRLSDMRDAWHLRYYDERIDTHYPELYRPLTRALLDQIVASERRLSLEDLVEGIDPAKATRDEETVRSALRLLGLDNYLTRDENGGYGFRYPFIARVWRAIRR